MPYSTYLGGIPNGGMFRLKEDTKNFGEVLNRIMGGDVKVLWQREGMKSPVQDYWSWFTCVERIAHAIRTGNRKQERVEINGQVTVKRVAKPPCFGFPITHVIRWMGMNDWDFDNTKAVLVKLGVDAMDNTILTQLNYGRKGRLSIPDLKDSDIELLYASV